MISPAKEYGYTSGCYTSLISSYDGIIPDFEKALCIYRDWEPFETSEYNTSTYKWETKGINSVNSSINRNIYAD